MASGSNDLGVGDSVLGVTFFGLGSNLGLVLVEFHELGEIELGLLEDLNLADEDILKREDLGAFFGDLLANRVGDASTEI